MSDSIEAYFTQLAHRAPDRLLRRTAGTIRIELEGPGEVDVWYVTIAGGRVEVSRERRDADTVIRTDRDFFARMARGEAKPLTGWLRNDLIAEGRFRFLMLLEQLFPAPPGARHPRALAGGRGEPR
ncbi:SCP2 sterol-binding domain-containing protein [Micromonospora sp. DR5-3]|uniref:SCP2 sterol-binding domain-containing protein n=1 Tax=unclassified Micromonospora TaxID=2617518 RepID=UPI001651CD1E|nr:MULTISPECIES: SCP2 sterol-binding domain-containing protein [unclassified Micromonospora]MCW3816104.1 SCP2 sterol-binding domain-containing protein [Micromonospora sp. DR5-3]